MNTSICAASFEPETRLKLKSDSHSELSSISAFSKLRVVKLTLFQAVATGLVAVGFGESVTQFFASESATLVKVIAIGTLLILTGLSIPLSSLSD